MVVLLPASPLAAQTPVDSAATLIQRALALMGTPAAIVAAGGLTFSGEGELHRGAEAQGHAPDSTSRGSFHERFSISAELTTIAREYREERYDGTWEHVHEVYRPRNEHLVFLPRSGSAFLEISSDAGRRRLLRRLPQFMLAEAMQQRGRARWIGTRDRTDVVEMVTLEGDTLELRFDRTSELLTGIDIRTDVHGIGGALIAWNFSDHREVAGVGLVPYRWTTSVAGRTFMDMRISQLRTGSDDAMFALPEGVAEPKARVVPANPNVVGGATVRAIAPGVHIVQSLRPGFHPMFVEFSDFVVAVDAPAGYRLMHEIPPDEVAPGPSSAWLSEEYLALIRRTVPGKPVRYVVLTHHHGDHAGGVRAFVAAGATVIAPAADTSALRRLIDAPHRAGPDASSRAPAPLRIEAVDQQRIISDGQRTIRVIEVGTNPHTHRMLVVHVPAEDLLFVSDLVDGSESPAHEALDRWFADWLARQALNVATLRTMHGSGVVTPERLAELRSR